jgi:hypothetical protein
MQSNGEIKPLNKKNIKYINFRLFVISFKIVFVPISDGTKKPILILKKMQMGICNNI